MKRISADGLRQLYAPVSQETEQGVDRVLSALPERKEKYGMKKKMFTVALAAALLALTTVTALAATNWERISAFLGGAVANFDVNEEAIVAPTLTENTSQWLHIALEEAYWSEEGLHLTMHVAPAADKQLIVTAYEIDGGGEEEDLPLDEKHLFIGDAPVTVGEWRQGREILTFEIDPGCECWSWYLRDEAGEDIILTLLDVDEKALAAGTELPMKVAVTNLMTGDREGASLMVSLPPMTRQPGRK